MRLPVSIRICLRLHADIRMPGVFEVLLMPFNEAGTYEPKLQQSSYILLRMRILSTRSQRSTAKKISFYCELKMLTSYYIFTLVITHTHAIFFWCLSLVIGSCRLSGWCNVLVICRLRVCVPENSVLPLSKPLNSIHRPAVAA